MIEIAIVNLLTPKRMEDMKRFYNCLLIGQLTFKSLTLLFNGKSCYQFLTNVSYKKQTQRKIKSQEWEFSTTPWIKRRVYLIDSGLSKTMARIRRVGTVDWLIICEAGASVRQPRLETRRPRISLTWCEGARSRTDTHFEKIHPAKLADISRSHAYNFFCHSAPIERHKFLKLCEFLLLRYRRFETKAVKYP